MRWVLCLMLACLLLAACNDNDNPTSSKPSANIFPLKVGNQWIYEETYADSAGTVESVDTFVWLISDDTTIGGETWYILSVDGVPSQEMGPLSSHSDGLWEGGSSGLLVFKYPAAVDDTIMINDDTATVESIDTSRTVPAGTFTCYQYKWVGPRDPYRVSQYHYLSPGVGRVEGEEYYKTSEGAVFRKMHTVLLSYHLE